MPWSAPVTACQRDLPGQGTWWVKTLHFSISVCGKLLRGSESVALWVKTLLLGWYPKIDGYWIILPPDMVRIGLTHLLVGRAQMDGEVLGKQERWTSASKAYNDYIIIRINPIPHYESHKPWFGKVGGWNHWNHIFGTTCIRASKKYERGMGLSRVYGHYCHS